MGVNRAPAIKDEITPIERTIQNMLKVYERQNGKLQMKLFLQHVEFIKSLYKDERCFTNNKELLHSHEMPAGFHKFMVFVFGVEYRNKAPVMRALFRECKKFKVNPRTIPLMDEERVHEDNVSNTRIDSEDDDGRKPA